MTDTQFPYGELAAAALDARRREAAELAAYPEMVSGQLKLLFHELEDLRYDAALMLTQMPDTTPGYRAVREAVCTAFVRETSPRVALVLATRVAGLAAAECDEEARESLQHGCSSPAGQAIRRFSCAALAHVHESLVPEVARFLRSQRGRAPELEEAIRDSLTVLERRECPEADGRRLTLWEVLTALRPQARDHGFASPPAPALFDDETPVEGSATIYWSLATPTLLTLGSREPAAAGACVRLVLQDDQQEYPVFTLLRSGRVGASARLQVPNRMRVVTAALVPPEHWERDPGATEERRRELRSSFGVALFSDPMHRGAVISAWQEWAARLPADLRDSLDQAIAELSTAGDPPGDA